MAEARIDDGNLKFNGWFKWAVGGLITALWGILIIAITMIGTNVIANDKLSRQRDSKLGETDVKLTQMIFDNRIMIAELKSIGEKVDAIKENQTEFKNLLRRTAPYERKE